MSLEIILAKRRRRYLERVWRRTRSSLDRSRYTKQLHICNRMMTKSKSDYYTSLLSNNSVNPRHMWNSVNKIIHREKSKPQPDYTSLDTLCSSFSKFFTDKWSQSRLSWTTACWKYNGSVHTYNYQWSSNPKIYKYFMRSWPISHTSSQTLYRLSDCSTDIINLSMREGVVPSDFKQGLETPLIKKKTLCRNEFIVQYLTSAFCQKYWRRL